MPSSRSSTTTSVWHWPTLPITGWGALDWPKAIADVQLDDYLGWMQSAYWISTTCRPAMSVPAGFTAEGLPVGIQVVGRHRDDFGVLQIAYAFEQATGFGRQRPPTPRISATHHDYN